MRVLTCIAEYINVLPYNTEFTFSEIEERLISLNIKSKDLQRSILYKLDLLDKIGFINISFSYNVNEFENWNSIIDDNNTIYFNYNKHIEIPFPEYLIIKELRKMCKNNEYIKTFERKCKIKMLKK